ncbi:hypothetical protein [uncultured Friedmanniella sp.]|uniref:hypothetical protein n=1 Tax=uncultured Friedmanniella sp. TaxID=335381 RepID=UPI0035CACA4D
MSSTDVRTAENRPRVGKVAKVLSLATIPLALVVSGLLVSQASYSAYSATTTNPAANWTSGTVALDDDDANSAAFNVGNLKPGTTGTKCVVVTSRGNLASAVKLYATDMNGTTPLAAYMNLTVTQGTGGSFGSCSGFSTSSRESVLFSGSFLGFGSTYTSYASGLGTWTPTGTADESRTFKFTYTLDSAAPDSTQGGTASGALVWEAQNS